MPSEHVETLVVGSGFGGSVVACRLAEAAAKAGEQPSLCVLEKGQLHPPRSFARSPHAMGRNLWDPSEALHGLFNIWTFHGIDAVVASGVGGGSLAYANVLIRRDPSWFDGDASPWPISSADLDGSYERVEADLGAQTFPMGETGFDVAKTREFHAATVALGMDPFLPNLAVSFRDEQGRARVGAPLQHSCNLHCDPANDEHMFRSTCRLCGECDFGCNFGSKNTLDYNLLTRAVEAGAEIRPLTEVQEIAPTRDGDDVGYRVRVQKLRLGVPRSELGEDSTEDLTCRRLVLAAGTLGTTHLLLRNRENLPGLSSRLGTRFSGNGDLITVATGCRERGRDGKLRPRRMDPGHGPVITSAIRLHDDGPERPGVVLEDAGYPPIVDWLVETVSLPRRLWRAVRLGARIVRRWITRRRDTNLSAEISQVLGDATRSSTQLPLLIMGRDVPNGTMTLLGDRKRLDVRWRIEDSKAYFDRAKETARAIAKQLGGRFNDSPLSILKRSVTVHALGGCPMAHSAEEGVVDSWGRVFGQPELYVADGSVVPGPIGPNPSLTIAALADRFAEGMLQPDQRVPTDWPGSGS